MKTRFGVFSVILALLTGTGRAGPASQPEKEGGDNAFTAALEVVESPVPKRQKGTVLAGVLNVRARPGLRFEVIAKLRKDDPVTVVAEEQDWFGIAVPKIAKAYIAARFLGLDGTVIGDKVRVRSGPGLVFTPYAELHEGEKVEPQGDPENGWQRITPPESGVGWVHRDFIAIEPPPEPPKAQTGEGTAAAAGIEEVAHETSAEKPLQEGEEGKKESGEPESNKPAVVKPAPEGAGESAGEQRKEAATEVPKENVVTLDGGSREKETQPAVKEVEPETAEVETTPPPAKVLPPVRVMREGIVVSLGDRATEYVSHTLSRQLGAALYPVCYLNCRSDEIDLGEWERKSVRVYGREIRYPGWSRPVIEVDGIQLVPDARE